VNWDNPGGFILLIALVFFGVFFVLFVFTKCLVPDVACVCGLLILRVSLKFI
jgi:hypothetical protein